MKATFCRERHNGSFRGISVCSISSRIHPCSQGGARADTAFTQTAPRPPLPLTPYGKLAAKNEPRESAKRKGEHHRESATRKKEHRENAKKKREPRESAKKKQKRAECEEQAEKLLYDADKRTYRKECISNL